MVHLNFDERIILALELFAFALSLITHKFYKNIYKIDSVHMLATYPRRRLTPFIAFIYDAVKTQSR